MWQHLLIPLQQTLLTGTLLPQTLLPAFKIMGCAGSLVQVQLKQHWGIKSNAYLWVF